MLTQHAARMATLAKVRAQRALGLASGLAALLSAGCGQSDDAACAACTGGTGGSGGVEGCVDVAITAKVLGDSKEWLDVGALSGPLWARADALHVAWVGYHSHSGGKTSVPWLVVGTIHPDLGTIVDAQTYSLFPPALTYVDCAIYSFAGRSDGTFAVGHAWVEDGKRPPRVAIGRLGSPELKTALIPLAVGDANMFAGQSAAGWDGEAFALHGYDAPPQFALFAARVDDQAQVLLPFTEFGWTKNPAYTVFTHRVSTDATSGRSFVFDADGPRIVNAHERSGDQTPLTKAGPMELKASGASEADSQYGVVSADSEGGAWFAWADDVVWGARPSLAVAHLDAKGSVTHSFKTQPPAGDAGNFARHALVPRPTGAWLVSATGYGMYTFDVADSGLSAPARLVEGLSDDNDVRDMEAIEFQGERWVSYAEYKAERFIRVLKAKPGCVYPARPALAGGE